MVVKNKMVEINHRRAALIAGFSIVIMAILAGFSYGYVLQTLIVPNNAVLTAHNIKASLTLFRSGICGFLLVIILDILVAWSLYLFFKSVHAQLSLLTAWFRLVYAGVFGIAQFNLIIIALLSSNSDYLSVVEISHVKEIIAFFFQAFNLTWAFGLVIFGCHLLLLGYLVFKSGSIPKIWSLLLFTAGLCYSLSNFAHLHLPNYDNYKASIESIITLPMVMGELGFGIWLLVRGGKIQET